MTPLSRPAGAAGGDARDLGPGTRPYATYAARASGRMFLAFVLPCAVTHTPSARYPEAQLPRRDQTPPRSGFTAILPALTGAQASGMVREATRMVRVICESEEPDGSPEPT